MDDHLSRLEARVQGAIDLIHDLRRQNGDLQSRCQELEQRMGDLQGERDRLQERLHEASAAAAQVEEFEERRRVIEQKVGSLLEKLEAMG